MSRWPHLSEAIAAHPRASPWTDAPEGEPFPDILEPSLRVVTEGDLARAPVVVVPEGVPIPTPGTLDEIGARLRVHPHAVALMELASWPVCHDRPATVIGIEQPWSTIDAPTVPEDLAPFHTEAEIRADWAMSPEQVDAALRQLDDPSAPEAFPRPEGLMARFFSRGWKPWPEHYAELRERARRGFDGTALFQCRVCGRVYLASHHVP